jgi:hypothetical protein
VNTDPDAWVSFTNLFIFFINTVVVLASLPIFDAEWVGGLPVLLLTVAAIFGEDMYYVCGFNP